MIEMVVNNHAFNANEWSVIFGFSIGLLLVFILPKRFPIKASLVFFMCGVYTGFFFDNSLTIKPFNLYVVNDTSKYEFMDYILYFAYGPISYLFFYGLDRISTMSKAITFYIFAWMLIVLGLERVGTLLDVFHYQHGYKISYSLPIYLVIFSLWFFLYRFYQSLTAEAKL